MTPDATVTHLRADSPLKFMEIEEICQKRGDLPTPPQAFLISSGSMRNSLLAVRADFLDQGESLSWPGLLLLGATFDLDWGYAFVEVNTRVDGFAEFEQPSCRFEDSAAGDTWGYRLCPVENHMIPTILSELAHIRNELSKPRKGSSNHQSAEIMITNL